MAWVICCLKKSMIRGFVLYSIYTLLGFPLSAQTFQTKFADVGVDKIGPSSQLGSIYRVDPASGSLNLSIPIGPGIGTSGLRFAPTVYGNITQQLQWFNLDGQNRYMTNVGMGMSLLPGQLNLKTGPHGDTERLKEVSSYELWNGINGTFDGPITTQEGKVNGTELIRVFDFESESVAVMKPFGLEGGDVPFVKYTSSGDIFIALYHPSKAPFCNLRRGVAGPGNIPSKDYLSPTKVLIIRDDIAYEFTSVVDPSDGRVYAEAHNRYRLTSIRNKFQERVDVVYSGRANVIDYTAEYFRGGISTGIKIDIRQSGDRVNVKYGPEGLEYDIDTTLYYPDPTLYTGWQNIEGVAPWHFRAALYQRVGKITDKSSNESLSISYVNDNFYGVIFSLPNCLSWSNGKKVNFEWAHYPYRRNDALNGVWQGYFTKFFSEWYYLELAKGSWVYGVTSATETDTNGGIRKTQFKRIVPIPDFKSRNSWVSTDFYTAIIHPDGSTVVETYWPPVRFGDGGPASSKEDQLQTLAHLKHLVQERRYYGSGVAWDSDRWTLPKNSLAYRVEQFDDLDFRRDGIPVETISLATLPTATSTKIWKLDSGVREELLLTDWSSDDFAFTNEKRSVYSGASLVYFSDTKRHFKTMSEYGIFNNIRSKEITIDLDTSGGLAPSCPQKVRLPFSQKAYGDQNNILNRTSSIFSDGLDRNGSSITKIYYQSENGLGANKIDRVLTEISETIPSVGNKKLGETGIAKYGYNTYGEVNSIKEIGAPWTIGQDSDQFGRPIEQRDANGIVTSYRWQGSRLVKIIRQSPEYSTDIEYASDHRGATSSTGNQKTEIRYNGFGEPILVRRWNTEGRASHKAFDYDKMGRKLFESVWLLGTGEDGTGQNAGIQTRVIVPKTKTLPVIRTYEDDQSIPVLDPDIDPLPEPITVRIQLVGDRWIYNDPQGRLTEHTDASGCITRTVYNGLSRTVTVGYGTAEARITTYTYDAIGRLVEVRDGLNQPTKYAYDPMGRIAQVTQSDPKTGSEQIRTWKYNGLGWLTSLSQPESGLTTYSDFTVHGNPQVTVYGSGSESPRIVRRKFDVLGRIISLNSDDGSVVQGYGYDEVNHGAANGKLTSDFSFGVSHSYTYSGLNGRLSNLDTRIGGSYFRQDYNYNYYGQKISSSMDGRRVDTSFDGATGLPRAVRYNGNIIVSAVYGGDSALPEDPSWNLRQLGYSALGTTSYFTYGLDQSRIDSTVHAFAGRTKQWKYSYNVLGQISGDGEDNYSYDLLGRLRTAGVKRFDNSIVSQTFDYDAFGNMVSLIFGGNYLDLSGGFTFNSADPALLKNRLPANSTTGAVYNGQGNLIAVNASPAKTPLNMTYDALGRITSLTNHDTGITEDYRYSADGLRAVIDERNGNSFLGRKLNIYNESRFLVSQYNHTPKGDQWKKDIVYMGSKEIAEIDAQGVHVTLTDHLGSPRVLVNPDGSVVEQKFLPFGGPLASPTNSAKFAKGFTNHEQTDASGLIYMQARFYLPMWGRFASPDPGRDQHFEETQSWNIYSYVRNNPVMMTDPTGMVAITPDDEEVLSPNARKLQSMMPNPSRVPVAGQGGLLVINFLNEVAKAGAETLADTPGDLFAVVTGRTIMGDKVDRRFAAAALAIPFVPATVGKAAKLVDKSGILWTSTKKMSSLENAARHFADHGADFGAKSVNDYASKAQQFMHEPPAGTLSIVRGNGDVVRFNPESNAFGVMDKAGATRTYYKPDPAKHGYASNMEYFNAQK